MKVCAEPLCPTLVPEGSWCDQHQPVRTGKPGTTRYLEDERWRKLSRAYLKRHPICQCGCGAKSTDVDHIDGLGLDGPHSYDWRNLIALAHSCHSRRTTAQGSRASRGLPA